MNNLENIDTKDIERLLNKKAFDKYEENELDNLDLTPEHLENAFTNEKFYLSMKPLSTQEKQVLYYSVVEYRPLNWISKKMNLTKKEILLLKEQAILNFKRNLKRGNCI